MYSLLDKLSGDLERKKICFSDVLKTKKQIIKTLDTIGIETNTTSPDSVISDFCNVYDTTLFELITGERNRERLMKRNSCIFLVKYYNRSITMQSLAELFGVSHGNIINSLRQVYNEWKCYYKLLEYWRVTRVEFSICRKIK